MHGRPIEYQRIRNGTVVMVSKPPYSFERLVNVYKVRLNVYKLNDRRIHTSIRSPRSSLHDQLGLSYGSRVNLNLVGALSLSYSRSRLRAVVEYTHAVRIIYPSKDVATYLSRSRVPYSSDHRWILLLLREVRVRVLRSRDVASGIVFRLSPANVSPLSLFIKLSSVLSDRRWATSPRIAYRIQGTQCIQRICSYRARRRRSRAAAPSVIINW